MSTYVRSSIYTMTVYEPAEEISVLIAFSNREGSGESAYILSIELEDR